MIFSNGTGKSFFTSKISKAAIGHCFFFRAESFFNLAEYIDEKGITQVKYEETEHYQITKGFLDNLDKYFKLLFRSE